MPIEVEETLAGRPLADYWNRGAEVAQLVAGLIAALNAHDLDQATTFFAAGCEGRDIAQIEPQRGRAGIRRALAGYFEAIPDVHFSLDDLVVGSGRAVVIWTAHGTHLGALMNIPARGRPVSVRGVSIFAVGGGQIVRAEHIWDVAGLLRELGLLPEL